LTVRNDFFQVRGNWARSSSGPGGSNEHDRPVEPGTEPERPHCWNRVGSCGSTAPRSTIGPQVRTRNRSP
jgi:hypothetical protein